MASPACSEDYDASETFAAALMDQIDNESVNNMVDVQREMLSRFEKTNEMLINFNILSADRFAVTSRQYRQHTQLMYDMKRDLDCIFKRIRVIKDKLGKSYPESFKVCGSSAPIPEDDEENEDTVAVATGYQNQNSKNSSDNDAANSAGDLPDDVTSEVSAQPFRVDRDEKNKPDNVVNNSHLNTHHRHNSG